MSLYVATIHPNFHPQARAIVKSRQTASFEEAVRFAWWMSVLTPYSGRWFSGWVEKVDGNEGAPDVESRQDGVATNPTAKNIW